MDDEEVYGKSVACWGLHVGNYLNRRKQKSKSKRNGGICLELFRAQSSWNLGGCVGSSHRDGCSWSRGNVDTFVNSQGYVRVCAGALVLSVEENSPMTFFENKCRSKSTRKVKERRQQNNTKEK